MHRGHLLRETGHSVLWGFLWLKLCQNGVFVRTLILRKYCIIERNHCFYYYCLEACVVVEELVYIIMAYVPQKKELSHSFYSGCVTVASSRVYFKVRVFWEEQLVIWGCAVTRL